MMVESEKLIPYNANENLEHPHNKKVLDLDSI